MLSSLIFFAGCIFIIISARYYLLAINNTISARFSKLIGVKFELYRDSEKFMMKHFYIFSTLGSSFISLSLYLK